MVNYRYTWSTTGTLFVIFFSQVCLLATSLGGVITNIVIPGSMTGVGLDDEFKARRNLGTNFLRISVGLEDIEDIIADIKQALDKAYL